MTIEELTIQDLRAENAQLRKQIDKLNEMVDSLRWQIENTEDDDK